MDRIMHKLHNANRRHYRNRATVVGSPERPRLSVHVSNKHITAQIINDSEHRTLAHVTTVGQKATAGTMTERAAWVGTEIAKKAKLAKVNKIVFDRGSRLYHGRVKALAEAVRKGGLEF